MGYNAIPFSKDLAAGVSVQLTFGFSDLYWPSVDDIDTALLAVPNFAPVSTKYDVVAGTLFGNSGTITGTITNPVCAEDLASDIKMVLAKFPTVYGVQIQSIAEQTSSIGSIFERIVGVDPTKPPSTSTTISLVAVAIMVLVVGLVIFKME